MPTCNSCCRNNSAWILTHIAKNLRIIADALNSFFFYFRPHDRTTGRAGAPLLDVKMKLVDWVEGNYLVTDTPNPRGEIHVGGNNVALGYYKNKPKTEEDFYDDEGLRWFRTGDIGEFDQDGVIR